MATNKELETGLVNGGTTYNQLLEILNGLWGISELNGWTVLRLGSKYTRYEMYAKAGTHILPVKFKETTIAYCAYTDGTIGSKVVKINDKVITVLKDCRIEITQISKGVLKDGGEGGRGEGGTISPEQQKLDEIWDAIHALQNQTASIATLRTMIEAEISARQSEFAQLTNSISSLDTRLNRVNEELQSKVDLDTYSNFKQSTNNTLTDHEQHLTDIDTKNDEQDTTLADHASHLETIDGHLDTIDSHLDTIDGHLDEIDEKNDEQDQTLSSHSETLSEHSTHLTNIDNQISEINDLDDAQNARLTALEAKPEINVAGTSNEITVSSNTSGNTKTFTVGIATDSKNKINTAYTHSQTQGNPHNTTIGDINGLQTELTSIESDLTAIESLIPDEATSSNKLADKAFVNSSITTNTATFRGTSAKNLTEAQFLAWANTLPKTKNDYVFWDTVDTDGNVVFKRYKYDGSNWIYEYSLNNSSFTSSQWASINSGIVSGDVSDLHTHLTDNTRHITAAERTSWNSKASDTALQNEITNRTNADSALGVRIDDVESDLSSHESNNVIHITSTERTNWNAKATPSDITNAINALDVNDSAVANQFVTKVSETDGKISVSRAQPQISDVKDLQTALDRRFDTYSVEEFNTKVTGSALKTCRVNLVRAGSAFQRAVLLWNVTDIWNTSTSSKYGVYFAGCFNYVQNGSNNNNDYVELDINVTPYASGLRLKSNSAYLRPVILTYTENETVSYYVALLITSIDCAMTDSPSMFGLWRNSHTFLGTPLKGDTNYSLPTGWEIYKDPNERLGQVSLARRLETARTIITNLASTATASFDGSANITPGVTGTLPIANGGTGATTRIAAEYNLLGGVEDLDSTLTDTRRFAIANQTKSSTNGVFRWYSLSTLWAWIAGKISSVLGLTSTNYSGTAAKATADASGNTITTTYATKTALNDKLDKTGLEYTSSENLVYQKFTAGSPNTSATDDGKSITISPENRDTYFLIKFADAVVIDENVSVAFDVDYEGDDDGNWKWSFGTGGNTGTSVTLVGSGHYVYHIINKRNIAKDANSTYFDDTARTILPTNSFKIKNIKIERGNVNTGFCLCPAEQRAATLTTPRSIQTNLGSTDAPTFDGSANITPGITGTLPITHGGTGATSAPAARTNLDVYSKSEVSTNYVSKVNNTTLNGGINTTWQRSDRYIKVDGNGITYSVNPKYMGGYANNLLAIADNTETHNVIGVYGANGTYNYSFLGGTYSNPNIKLTKEGVATFKNAPLVPALKNSNGTYTYTFNASSGGELALTSQVNTKEPTFTLSYNSTTKRLKTTKSINII